MHLEFMVSFQVFIIIWHREDVEWPLIMLIVITAFMLLKVDVLLDGREEPRQGLKGCVH